MKQHRFYSFVNNLYMSPIQWGIQTSHCVSTMMAKAFAAPPLGSEGAEGDLAQAMRWATGSPTVMVCEGTNVKRLLELEAQIAPLASALGLPFASFREDMDSLGGIITSVAVLIPEDLFLLDKAALPDGSPCYQPKEGADPTPEPPAGGLPLTPESNPAAYELLELVKSAKLAR